MTYHKAPCIAVLGTGSDVGKSIVVTALCRIFANKRICVAPFKAQNMSNNSGVTIEGKEMGRAQIAQAEASKIPPHVDMNPILLKPTTDIGSQVVLLGEVFKNSSARDYHEQKDYFFLESKKALDRLREGYDLIVIEGAGSCAEVNLMPDDIVNFRMAEYAEAPVILVADIHRGGVFAQIIGTLECLKKEQRDRIIGFIINRFRGDISLFKDGLKFIEDKTNKPVLGVLPWYHNIKIDPEDSVVIESPKKVSNYSKNSIAVIRLPHISNFTDFYPLSNFNNLSLFFIEEVQDLSNFVAVILPGSKNTCFDLNWLNTTGWRNKILDYTKNGGNILGICGGYQMLGEKVCDPHGLEGNSAEIEGLKLLPIETFLQSPKITTLTHFVWNNVEGTGYEIHMGKTVKYYGSNLFNIIKRNNISCETYDGCISEDSKIIGTYIHGIFDNPAILQIWFDIIGLKDVYISNFSGRVSRDKEYDLLAEHFEKYIDCSKLFSILNK
ncbi:MAG: cobyric acid synthase [Desulfobacterales bacterium]|nr:cobyric acid synthase [Desulfobacterales bacterium]